MCFAVVGGERRNKRTTDVETEGKAAGGKGGKFASVFQRRKEYVAQLYCGG